MASLLTETAVHRTVTYTSPSPPIRHVKTRVGLERAMKRLPTTTANTIIVHRLHDPRSLSFGTPKLMMADNEASKMGVNRTGEPSAETEKKGEEATAQEAEISPPEKPLPGDCCGSGCVRCVWDVYYEELEDYNNRCKKESKAS